MKLVLSMDEVICIVVDELKRRGFRLSEAKAVVTTETHGSYEDTVTEPTGLSFDLTDSQR